MVTTDDGRARARILLVEDDGELRALIATTLTNAGFEVIEASDGEGFIERLTEPLNEAGKGFDVVLSDIQMPPFSALDVLVAAHPLIGKTPVVLMSAFVDGTTHQQALLRGARAILDKPVRMALLCETVANLLPEALARPGTPAGAIVRENVLGGAQPHPSGRR